ncbi:class I SAM-dependent methyltransferase [Streptomyces stackebrandtii]|uniref:class I SAM-dependent methyltransferase n=1 Tax=Streptomyces stackebrandtii TaxID=3051177 RepID=UPI0028DCEAD0|nr:class I SAM-dependent methyltransferase [Streptomyces sp. DSM 40976]
MKSLNTSTWAAGDYPAMARLLVPAADRAVAAAAPGPGTTVLDVGTGTGNAALAAARAGATVTAVDPTPELLAIAERRAVEEALTVIFQDGDTAPGTYDRVLSVFATMYAPDHTRAAASLVRACAPGGRIVSAAWTPDGLMAAANRAAAPYLPPPPPGGQPPTRWGDEAYVRGLFAGHEVATTVEQVPFVFAAPMAAAEFWVRTAGHVQAERARLEAGGAWRALHHDLAAVFAGRESSATYLLAVVSA